MLDAAPTQAAGADHLRVARLLDAHGQVIAALCAYREVIRSGIEPAAAEARLRVAALAGDYGTDPDRPA